MEKLSATYAISHVQLEEKQVSKHQINFQTGHPSPVIS
jgi:hypothetical protein